MKEYTNIDIENMLKEETKSLVPNLLEKIKKTPIDSIETEGANPKRNLFLNFSFGKVALTLLALLIIGSASSVSIVYASEYETISLDTSALSNNEISGVELSVNAFDIVKDVKFTSGNSNIFDSKKIKHKKVKEALQYCVDRLVSNNIISEENDRNIIVVSGYSNKHQVSSSDVDKWGYYIDEYFNDSSIYYEAVTNTVDEESYNAHNNYNFSYGDLWMMDYIMMQENKYNSYEDFYGEDFKNMDHKYTDYYMEPYGPHHNDNRGHGPRGKGF